MAVAMRLANETDVSQNPIERFGNLQHSSNYRSFEKKVDLKNESKPKIPLVKNVINDEDINAVQGEQLKPIALNKIVKLLVDPHSALLHERHVFALKKIVKHYSNGFMMKDLLSLFKILNVCADRISEVSEYVDPMIDLLKICGKSFFKEKMSDEISYSQIAMESIAQLGYLMRVSNSEIRAQICDTITSFYMGGTEQVKVKHLEPCQLAFNRRIVETCDISETLVKSLALLEGDFTSRLNVIKVLQTLSTDSPIVCEQMLGAEAARQVILRMLDADSSGSGELLFRSVDILWNLLEFGPQQVAVKQLNNVDCVERLRDAFIQQVTTGYSHYDRQLRNDILVIAILLAEKSGSVASENSVALRFLETGFVRDLILLTTFQELKSHHALVRHLKLGPSHEDFELKKLLMVGVATLSRDRCTLPLLRDGRLLPALYSYVRAGDTATAAGSAVNAARDWSAAERVELQLLALATLTELAPRMLDEHAACQGSTRILLMLEWCCGGANIGDSTAAGNGCGNSVLGDGCGAGERTAQLRHCLRLMRALVSTDDPGVLQDFTDQGAINQLVSVLNDYATVIATGYKSRDVTMTTINAVTDTTSIDVEITTDLLFILASLCDDDPHRKELFGSGGVDALVALLGDAGMLVQLSRGGRGHHRLALAAVDAARATVTGAAQPEERFLEREGVFLLLDLLDACARESGLAAPILGALLELCENPRAPPHLASWRAPPAAPGRPGATTATLLCQLWRDEERRLGVSRDESGTITDVTHPLMSSTAEQSTAIVVAPARAPSRAILEVSENLRAKIYSLLAKLDGFRDPPGGVASVNDHVTLVLIEHYLDFKTAEVWAEVDAELEAEGCRPTTPDRDALTALQRCAADRRSHVQAVQRELAAAGAAQLKLDEREQHAALRAWRQQSDKAQRDRAEFVSRCSDVRLLRAARERQRLEVAASRAPPVGFKPEGTHHQLELEGLNTTVYCGQHVRVNDVGETSDGAELKQAVDEVLTK